MSGQSPFPLRPQTAQVVEVASLKATLVRIHALTSLSIQPTLRRVIGTGGGNSPVPINL